MRKYVIIISTILFALLSLAMLQGDSAEQLTETKTEIKWYSMEEALAAHAENPKKMFIDVYTDWCHWCKVMDQKTFSEPKVIDYLNENFYAVKFNAEQREPITFKGQEFVYTPAGRRGIHLLAYALLDQQASYPSFVVLNDELNRMGILKGFLDSEKFLARMNQTVAK